MSWLRSRPSTKRFIPVPPNPEREYQIRRFHTVWPLSRPPWRNEHRPTRAWEGGGSAAEGVSHPVGVDERQREREHRWWLCQSIKQGPRSSQVGRSEAFGKAAVDRPEKPVG